MSRMPQVTARELVRFLKSQGFVEDRQSGSHLTLWHAERNLSVTVPVRNGHWPVSHPRQKPHRNAPATTDGEAPRIGRHQSSFTRIEEVCSARARHT
jgi:predicted RNA binding protein YcfA (HicA-like mRNA interferase family)